MCFDGFQGVWILLALLEDSNGEILLPLLLGVERGIEEAAGAMVDQEIRRESRAAAALLWRPRRIAMVMVFCPLRFLWVSGVRLDGGVLQ